MAVKRISPKEAARLGWSRVDGQANKLYAKWLHRDGYRLEHCGHPTALYPWAMYAPDGRMIRAGALWSPPEPDKGHAWKTLAMAMQFVEEVVSGKRKVGGKHGA